MNIQKYLTQKKAHYYKEKCGSLSLKLLVFKFQNKELHRQNEELRRTIYKLKQTRTRRFKNYIKRKFICGYETI